MPKKRKRRNKSNESYDSNIHDLWEVRKKGMHEEKPLSVNAILDCSNLTRKESAILSSNLAQDDNYCEVVVLSIDIRRSSVALAHVEDFYEYAEVLTDFICYIKDTWCNKKGRFFDKFTGDGALCFWILPEEPPAGKSAAKSYIRWNKRVKDTVDFSTDVCCKFMEIALPGIRKTCGLIPRDFGLSIGIDAGECLLTEMHSSKPTKARKDSYEAQYGQIHKGKDGKIEVSKNVTIIGRPVIGATRMVTAARAYEIILNTYPGALLKDKIDDPKEHEIHEELKFGLNLVFRKVKEYEHDFVEVYRVNSDRIEYLKQKMGLSEECEEKQIKSPIDSKKPSDTKSKAKKSTIK